MQPMVSDTLDKEITYRILVNNCQAGPMRNYIGDKLNESRGGIKISYIIERDRKLGLILNGNITEDSIRKILLEKYSESNFTIRKDNGEELRTRIRGLENLPVIEPKEIEPKVKRQDLDPTIETLYSSLTKMLGVIEVTIPSRKALVHNLRRIREITDETSGKIKSKLGHIEGLETLITAIGEELGEQIPIEHITEYETFEKYSIALIERAKALAKKSQVASEARAEAALQTIGNLASGLGYALIGFDPSKKDLDIEKYVKQLLTAIKVEPDKLKGRARVAELRLEEQETRLYKTLELIFKAVGTKLPDRKKLLGKSLIELLEPLGKDISIWNKDYIKTIEEARRATKRSEQLEETLREYDRLLLSTLTQLSKAVEYEIPNTEVTSKEEIFNKYLEGLTSHIKEKTGKAKLAEKLEPQFEEIITEKARLEALVANGSVGNLATEELLVEAFKKSYSGELETAILEYNRLFPEGIPEEIIQSQTDLRDLIYENLGERLIAINNKLGNRDLTLDEITNTLYSYKVEFQETEYAQTHDLTYRLAKQLEQKTFRHKKDADLTSDETEARVLVRHYEDAKKEHHRLKLESEDITKEITALKELHVRVTEETKEFRKSNLPIKATFGCYSYYVHDNEGYRLRLVVPTNDKNYQENAAMDLSLELAATLKGRNAELKTGILRDCYFIDLIYKNTTPERLSSLIEDTKTQLQKSSLVKVGARIDIKYFGELKL